MRKKPPSRVRYERSHPMVSARLDKDTYDKLREMVKSEGRSLAGFLKDFVRHKRKSWKGAYQRGFKRGKKCWRVWYYCNVCGEEMDIAPESREHQDIIDYMKRRGWGHGECHEKGY